MNDSTRWLFTELPAEAGIDSLITGKITPQKETVVIPDNQHAAPGLDALIRARNWQTEQQATSIYLNCRDRNRIDLATRYLTATHMGIHSVIIDTGMHTRSGPYPEARPVYDLDPTQVARFLRQFGDSLSEKELRLPLIGIRIQVQDSDSFELERIGRVCRSNPDFLVLHTDHKDDDVISWKNHCLCLDGFSEIKLILEIPSGQWDNRHSLPMPKGVSGILIKY